jgi:SAM-dependent methyltransferase
MRPRAAAAPYGELSSAIYDSIYADKDYEAECDLIEEAFARHRPTEVRSLLDLGCGSGGHLLPLARRGYEVAGVDLSPGMLDVARRKVADAGLPGVDLHQGDLRSVRLGRTFDAALLMFAVLGYQSSNDDVLAALRTVRAHLRPGGVLCFDVWYGPAVLTAKPERRRRTIETPRGAVVRSATPELDVRRHLCTVHYRFEGRGGEPTEEDHVMRFFFPMELDLFLSETGLELLSLTPFGSLDGEPYVETWSVFAVARAASG